MLGKDEGMRLGCHLRKNPVFSRDFSKGENYCILAALLDGESSMNDLMSRLPECLIDLRH
jgi:hypothetical protein